MAAVTAGVVGAGLAYKGAKDAKKAQDRATKANKAAADAALDFQREGFDMSKPYFQNIYAGADAATQQAIQSGPYQGQTFAGMDQRTRDGLNQQYNNAVNNAGFANNAMGATSGFANNAANLYNNAANTDRLADGMAFASQNDISGALDFSKANNTAQDAMNFGQANNTIGDAYNFAANNTNLQDADAFAAGSTNVQDANAFAAGSTNVQDALAFANQDDMQGALDYASGDRLDSMVSAAMRDPYRQLTEQTLTGIDARASGSGNMNSSRAGIADAIAQRSYDDRAADVAAGIQDKLMTQYLGNRDTLSEQFLDDRNTQSDRFIDDRNTQSDRFIDNRRDVSGDYMDAQQNAADMYTDSSQFNTKTYLNNQRDMRDSYTNNAGQQFSDMTTANNNLGNIFGNAVTMQGNATNNMIGAGDRFQADTQAGYNDAMNRYLQQNGGFNMGVYGQQAGIMSGAPQSGTAPTPYYQKPNMYDPSMAALTGGMSGFTAFGGQMPNFNLFGNNQAATFTPTTTFDVTGGIGVPSASGNVGSLYGSNPFGLN